MNHDEKNLHQKFVNYGMNAKQWLRKCVMLLPEIEKQLIWRKKGFSSIYEYAAKLAGMNHNQVNEALRVLAKIEDMPELQKIAEQKGINAVKPVVTIATQETAGFWAGKVAIMSKNTLEIYTREFKNENLHELLPRKEFETTTEKYDRSNSMDAGSTLNSTSAQRVFFEMQTTTPLIKKIVGMELESEVLEQLEKLKGDGSWNDLLKQLLNEREEQLEAQKPEAVQAVSRAIPAKIKRFVKKRANGVCAYPGCTTKIKILHHTERYAIKKEHNSNSIEGLCKPHERIVHLGLVENEDQAAKNWRVRREPDQESPKYAIDRIVQKYRSFG